MATPGRVGVTRTADVTAGRAPLRPTTCEELDLVEKCDLHCETRGGHRQVGRGRVRQRWRERSNPGTPQEDRIDEAHGVVHHDAGGHEDQPATGELVQGATDAGSDHQTGDSHRPAGDPLTRQRAAAGPRPRR